MFGVKIDYYNIKKKITMKTFFSFDTFNVTWGFEPLINFMS